MEVHSSERWSCVKLNGEDLLGMKIKKEEKMQIEKLPTLKLKYTLVVPFMGIVDALTMGSFFMNPAADGKLFIKAFYVICGIAGILFALWGLLWKTTIDGKTIKQDDYMGIGDSSILSVGQDLKATTLEMVDAMVDEDSAIVSIYYGTDATEEAAEEIGAVIEEKYPDVEVEINAGGQPIYYYVISVE